MTYGLEIRPDLDRKLRKLYKRNKKQYELIMKKVEEIVVNPHHYKNLRRPLNFLKRVHIARRFVLTFSVNDKTKTVTLEDYDHHDNIYKEK